MEFPEPTELLTANETAKRLRCTYGGLAQARHHRRWPLAYVKIGRRIFYTRKSVEQFIADRTFPGDGPRPADAKPQRQKRAAR